MSCNANYSLSNRILVNSNIVVYENDCLSEEKKIANEKQVIDELSLDLPTDIKVSNNSKKTFIRRRENSSKIVNENPDLSPRSEIFDLTNPHVVEAKTQKHLLKNLRSEKRRRHFSEGASLLQNKSEKSFSHERQSQILEPSTTTFDLNSNVPNLHPNESANKLQPCTRNINSVSSSKKSGASVPSLRLSISSLDNSNFKKGPLTKRKMRVSTSEKSVSRSPKGEIQIARKYIDSVGMIIKVIQEKEALVFNRALDRFEIKKINTIKPEDIESSLRKILSKIKIIVDYELNDMGSEQDVNSFDEIISYLEQANWSASLFEKNSKSLLDIELVFTKKVIDLLKQQVKNQILVRNELPSTELVGLLFFNGELEASEPLKKLTLDDLSLVFPKILSLSALLSKIWQVLIQLKIYEPQNIKEPLPQTLRILEFCVKCFESQVALRDYLEQENELRNLLESICKYASPEMQSRLNAAFENTLKYADEIHNAAARSKFFDISNSCQVKKSKIIEGTNPEICHKIGFYHYIKDLKKDRQSIICEIARSIVKKSASEFRIPLDELLSGKVDSKLDCPCYTQMSNTINSLSYVVASDILSYKDVAERREVIIFYTDVIKECIAMGDFASSYSLKMGFDLFSVSRLRDTWDKDTQNQIKFSEELFDQKNFYGNLFKVMENCQSNYFIMPPTLFGSKLNFIEENLSKGVIKQSQLRRLARDVLIPFQKIQKNLSNLPDDKILITNEIFDRKLESLRSSLPDENTLFKLSEQIEPRK